MGCQSCQNRVYLNIIADSRMALSNHIGSVYFNLTCPHCDHPSSYHVNDVQAESSPSGVPAGAILGGIIGGLLGGPACLLLGGLFGAGVGEGSDRTEKNRVNNFNAVRM